MTLEERYNTAAPTTTAGRVRTTQAADVGAKTGVDLMDAGARASTTADQFQSNFERRASNDKTVVQSKETVEYAPAERKGLSRWFGRALNYAFTDPKAPGNYIQDSMWTSFKSIKPETNDVWKDNPTNFHRWTPAVKFSADPKLSQFAKTKAVAKTAPSA